MSSTPPAVVGKTSEHKWSVGPLKSAFTRNARLTKLWSLLQNNALRERMSTSLVKAAVLAVTDEERGSWMAYQVWRKPSAVPAGGACRNPQIRVFPLLFDALSAPWDNANQTNWLMMFHVPHQLFLAHKIEFANLFTCGRHLQLETKRKSTIQSSTQKIKRDGLTEGTRQVEIMGCVMFLMSFNDNQFKIILGRNDENEGLKVVIWSTPRVPGLLDQCCTCVVYLTIRTPWNWRGGGPSPWCFGQSAPYSDIFGARGKSSGGGGGDVCPTLACHVVHKISIELLFVAAIVVVVVQGSFFKENVQSWDLIWSNFCCAVCDPQTWEGSLQRSTPPAPVNTSTDEGIDCFYQTHAFQSVKTISTGKTPSWFHSCSPKTFSMSFTRRCALNCLERI